MTAAPHAHDLVLGQHSVDCGPAMLRAGEQRISEIHHRLHTEGRI